MGLTKNKEVVSEIALQKQALADLQGKSAAYVGSIESMVAELESTNKEIEDKLVETALLVKQLNETKDSLNSLRTDNKNLIGRLKNIFTSDSEEVTE